MLTSMINIIVWFYRAVSRLHLVGHQDDNTSDIYVFIGGRPLLFKSQRKYSLCTLFLWWCNSGTGTRAGVKYVFVFANTNTNTNTVYLYLYLIKFQAMYLYLYLYLIHRIWCIWQIPFQIHFFPGLFTKHKFMEHKLTWIFFINMLKSDFFFKINAEIYFFSYLLVIVLVHFIWLVNEYVTNN